LRRYFITLVIMAVLVGSLFRAADQTGVRLMKMYGTFGIFLFGVVGTMALTRWQSQSGLKETEQALKSLEPDAVLTDWARQGGDRPDYLIIGPGGAVAVCVDQSPRPLGKRRAAASVDRGRVRAAASSRWLEGRLAHAATWLVEPAASLTRQVPVSSVLVLTRRHATPEESAEGVAVVNPDQLAGHVRSLWARELLDSSARVQLTRALRRPEDWQGSQTAPLNV